MERADGARPTQAGRKALPTQGEGGEAHPIQGGGEALPSQGRGDQLVPRGYYIKPQMRFNTLLPYLCTQLLRPKSHIRQEILCMTFIDTIQYN